MRYSCPICGYVHEGTPAPEICPQCKQKVTWKELDENAALTFVTEHEIGIAKGTGEEMIQEWHQNNKDKNVLIFRFANPLGANSEYEIGDHPKTNSKSIMTVPVSEAEKPLVS